MKQEASSKTHAALLAPYLPHDYFEARLGTVA
jgi:hypothetical protein